MIKINEDSKSKEVEKWLQQEFRKEKYRKMREDLKHFNGKILFSFTEDELEKLYQEDGLKLYKKLRTGPSNDFWYFIGMIVLSFILVILSSHGNADKNVMFITIFPITIAMIIHILLKRIKRKITKGY